MKEHLFIASCDGALYDTRNDFWHNDPPLRKNYRMHHASINSISDFKATLRAGPYAWPGGYPLYFVQSDGEAICFKCARKEARLIMEAQVPPDKSGWRVVACDINYEDETLQCCNCNDPIESAYGEK